MADHTIHDQPKGGEVFGDFRMTAQPDEDLDAILAKCRYTDLLLADSKRLVEAAPSLAEAAALWVRLRRVIMNAAPPHYADCGCTGPRKGEPFCPCVMKFRVLNYNGALFAVDHEGRIEPVSHRG